MNSLTGPTTGIRNLGDGRFTIFGLGSESLARVRACLAGRADELGPVSSIMGAWELRVRLVRPGVCDFTDAVKDALYGLSSHGRPGEKSQ
jgi:hypothetical protein